MLNDFILFAVFPYVAVGIELSVSIFRYYTNSYRFSSLSSEFLEGKELFWGSVPWHYGIIVVLLGHLIGFLFPKEVLAFGSVPMRLLILEVTALIFGMMAFWGLIFLLKRRFTNKRIKAVTAKMDIFVLVLLLIQVGTGLATAIHYRWGSTWYASAMVPYLKSLFVLKPNISYITGLPWVVKLHIFNAMFLNAIIPFTRLVHFLVLPIHYIWRSWQIVIWNWDRKNIRK